MTPAQVIIVDLEGILEEIGELMGTAAVALHSLDDLDEGIEMAGVVGADLIMVNCDLGGIDPVEVVARWYSELEMRDPPFAFIDPTNLDRTRIVRRDTVTGEIAVQNPAPGDLGGALRLILSPTGPPPLARVGPGNLRDRMIEIGFNDTVKEGGRTYSIQTEVHTVKNGVTVRCSVFHVGRLMVVRNFPVVLGQDPIGEVMRLAQDVHRETCTSVVKNLSRCSS